MERADRGYFKHSEVSAPTLVIPRRRPATEEEKARRRELFAEAERLRAVMGPLGMTVGVETQARRPVMERAMRRRSSGTLTLPKLPEYVPASSEEIARRKALAEEVDRLADEIGPLGYDSATLIREDREGH